MGVFMDGMLGRYDGLIKIDAALLVHKAVHLALSRGEELNGIIYGVFVLFILCSFTKINIRINHKVIAIGIL